MEEDLEGSVMELGSGRDGGGGGVGDVVAIVVSLGDGGGSATVAVGLLVVYSFPAHECGNLPLGAPHKYLIIRSGW